MNRITFAITFLLGAIMLSLSAGSASAAFTTGSVNMRNGPGTGYGIITVVPRGAPVAIIACNPRRSWCQTQWGRHVGWVSGRYLSSGAYAPPAYVPGYIYPPAIVLDIHPDRRWKRHRHKHRRYRHPRRKRFHWDYK
ncbi:MAG: SH3 domain-containing protein [Pseudomonadota bacterium]|nr:SH3 domain-containing protein [Pseudomonadota bacterium]